MNAIAYSPTRHVLRDPFHGREDLARRILRAVGMPADRMREDWLRALRALRFAGRFGLEIEAATWRAIVAAAPNLTRLSRERVRQEIEKTMEQVQLPGRSFMLWRSSGALAALLPAVAAGGDVALTAADGVARPADTARPERASLRQLVRMASLFSGLEPEVAGQTLRGLRCSNRDIAAMTHIATARMAVEGEVRAALGPLASLPTDATLRRWAGIAGRTTFAAVFRTLVARLMAEASLDRRSLEGWRAAAIYRRGLRIAFRDPMAVADLAIDGGDLLAMGIAPGPAMGEILRQLLDEVMEDPSRNTRESLCTLVRERAGGDPPTHA
jgi:hypothetical protein